VSYKEDGEHHEGSYLMREQRRLFASRNMIKDIHYQGYVTNNEMETLENGCFQEALFTVTTIQLVVMSLQVVEDIGVEVHSDVVQFIHVEAGTGNAILDGEESDLADGLMVVVPAGTRHNIVNSYALSHLSRTPSTRRRSSGPYGA
jgi:mannose-6-phosphate isomerase-like protein (cupin superfamily)